MGCGPFRGNSVRVARERAGARPPPGPPAAASPAASPASPAAAAAAGQQPQQLRVAAVGAHKGKGAREVGDAGGRGAGAQAVK